jgi:hypothetical protein
MNDGIYQIEIDEVLRGMCDGCPCQRAIDTDPDSPPYNDCPLNLEPKVIFVEEDFSLRCARRESEKEHD